jgi:hypothetical protein
LIIKNQGFDLGSSKVLDFNENKSEAKQKRQKEEKKSCSSKLFWLFETFPIPM